jgi:hypothetical protein
VTVKVIVECGLTQSNCVMVALKEVSWPRSYIDIEWWANAGPEISREVASTARSETILVFTVTPLEIQIFTARGGYSTHINYTL